MYEIIDVNNSKNLRIGDYDPATRTRLAPGFENDPPDFGHCVQWVFNTDVMSMLRVCQAAGQGTSTSPGFVFHNDHQEIEYLMSGTCLIRYPNGKTYDLVPGNCLCHIPNQPHWAMTTSSEHMKLCVVYLGRLEATSRTKWDVNKYYFKDGGYQMVHCPQHPSVEGMDPLLDVKYIYETPNLSFADMRLKPGCVVPVHHFISNINADEMLLVLSGEGIAIYPDKTYKLYYDIAVYNRSGQPYRLINTGKEDLHLLCYYSVSDFKNLLRKEIELSF